MYKQVFRGDLSETSTVASKLGTPGELRQDASGNIYRLFKVGSLTMSGGVALQPQSDSDGLNWAVAPAIVTSKEACGFHNQQTASLAAGAYFWGQVNGTGSAYFTATAAANSYGIGTAGGHLITYAQADLTKIIYPHVYCASSVDTGFKVCKLLGQI